MHSPNEQGLPLPRRVTSASGTRLALGVLLGAIWCAPLPAAAATDAERAAARSAANAGVEAFEQKRWAEALDRFTRAESLVHSPVHLLYIGQSELQLGQLVEAHEAFTKISREALPADASTAVREAQRDANKELEALEARLPYVTVTVEGGGNQVVQVKLDGAEFSAALLGLPAPINPGNHEFQAAATGFASEVTSLSIGEGAKQTVVLALKPTAVAEGPAPSPAAPAPAPGPDSANGGGANGMRIGSYVAFGVGAVGIAAGTIFALKASSKRGDADDLCNGPGGKCPIDSQSQIESLDSDARGATTLSIVSFAVGGVAIGTGVALFVMSGSKKDESSPQTASLTPWVGLGSAGVRGRF